MLLASHVFLSLGYHFLLAVSKDPYGQQQTQAVTMSITVILTTLLVILKCCHLASAVIGHGHPG